MKRALNVIGSTLSRLRYGKDWTQEMLSAKCSVLGVEVTRGTLAKIEAGLRGVNDAELFVLAKALKVEMSELFPPEFKQRIEKNRR
ncbi:MAG: helix-turn-helix domain-containing protein [Verrucomicrobiales bacterium]|jgi:transcriptional regulator with XRE-family HTH domain|nr:helix-turn-helix domain-containing protein [Verrucomicrobiales bacterium]